MTRAGSGFTKVCHLKLLKHENEINNNIDNNLFLIKKSLTMEKSNEKFHKLLFVCLTVIAIIFITLLVINSI